MTVRKLVLRFMSAAATLIAALAIAAPPPTLAARQTVVIDSGSPATNCGKYDGKTAEADIVMATINAPTGSTIVVCPGTYVLNGAIGITGKKMAIKRAITAGSGSRPILIADNTENRVLTIVDSAVTIDGLVIDGRGGTSGYCGIDLTRSSATIKNTMLIGPQGGHGIISDATGQSKMMNLSISASSILGYNYGVSVDGPIKLSVTGSTFDGTDGGRITTVPSLQTAINFRASTTPRVTPSGTVSKSQFTNNQTGVSINAASKVSISSNAFFNNFQSVSIAVSAPGMNNADNIKIISNIIMGVPDGGIGIVIQNAMVPTFTLRNAMISKNVITAVRYGGSRAILVSASMPTTTGLTVTVSGNTLFGFPAGSQVINVGGRAKITEKGTNATP